MKCQTNTALWLKPWSTEYSWEEPLESDHFELTSFTPFVLLTLACSLWRQGIWVIIWRRVFRKGKVINHFIPPGLVPVDGVDDDGWCDFQREDAVASRGSAFPWLTASLAAPAAGKEHVGPSGTAIMTANPIQTTCGFRCVWPREDRATRSGASHQANAVVGRTLRLHLLVWHGRSPGPASPQGGLLELLQGCQIPFRMQTNKSGIFWSVLYKSQAKIKARIQPAPWD